MDMRLPAGLQAADAPQAAHADHPPLRLLQRWRPATAAPFDARDLAAQLDARTVATLRAGSAGDLPRWRLKLQQLFSA